MTGLVVLLISGLLITGASESHQGKWTGAAMATLAALAIVTITVANTLELVTT